MHMFPTGSFIWLKLNQSQTQQKHDRLAERGQQLVFVYLLVYCHKHNSRTAKSQILERVMDFLTFTKTDGLALRGTFLLISNETAITSQK